MSGRDANAPGLPTDRDAASIRLGNLRRESEVRSIGQLCYLVAGFSLLGTLEFLLFSEGYLAWPPEVKALASPGLVRLAFRLLALGLLFNAVGQAAIGRGLTHLRAWARWTVVALTALSLASYVGLGLAACWAFPVPGSLALAIGGAAHGLILYPLVKAGSGEVFSESYREVIRQTPGIRGRMHWLLKLLIGLILSGVVGLALFLGALSLRVID